MARIVDTVLDLLFPPKCVFCRHILAKGETGICKECEKTLPFTPNGGRRRVDFVEACVAPLYYEGSVRDSLLRYKFNDMSLYARQYGALVADCVRQELAGEYDLVSWVPLSKARLRERGYDQAMLLAMAAALELDTVAVETLRKVIDTPPQSGQGDAAKRRANITGAYECVDKALVEGKRILLIDDIVTTGSTVSECARTLGLAGAEKVFCASLARHRD